MSWYELPGTIQFDYEYDILETETRDTPNHHPVSYTVFVDHCLEDALMVGLVKVSEAYKYANATLILYTNVPCQCSKQSWFHTTQIAKHDKNMYQIPGTTFGSLLPYSSSTTSI